MLEESKVAKVNLSRNEDVERKELEHLSENQKEVRTINLLCTGLLINEREMYSIRSGKGGEGGNPAEVPCSRWSGPFADSQRLQGGSIF